MYRVKFKVSRPRKGMKAKPIKRSLYAEYLYRKGAGWNE